MYENRKAVMWATLIVYCILMFVFTFGDLGAAIRVYNADSFFARCFEIVGTLPMPAAAVFFCVALIVGSDGQKDTDSQIPNIIIGILMAFFIFYGCLSFGHAVTGGWIPLLAILLVWIPVSRILVFKIMEKGNGDGLRRAAFIGVCGCAAAVFGPMIIKGIMSRPRFYTLEDPAAEFTYWFVRHPHNPRSADSSFPSGHTAQAATILTLLLVPMFADKCRTKRYRWSVLAASGVFIFCVMIARMIVGMHYATDVITGVMITVFFMEAAELVLSKWQEKETFRWNSCDLQEKYGS
ncbi:MAG: phosphatase PAP2 family protein [Clostridiales bacterium]|nr:phosphatase PAP2 family protein [Clostridiales bacterium]